MRTLPILALSFAITATTACENGGANLSPQPIATRRDSAGIEIVDNPMASGAPRSAFIVSSAPAIDIGVREGEQDYMLNGVTGVARLSDGRLVVAEFLPPRLRYYDAEGRHIRTTSIAGNGPGEVEAIRSMTLSTGDSLLVVCCVAGRTISSANDPSTGNLVPRTRTTQISLYDSAGHMGRRANLAWPDTPSKMQITGNRRSLLTSGDPTRRFEAAARDGSFIIRGGAWAELQGKPGTRWVHAPYFRSASDGSRTDTLIILPVRDVEEAPGAEVEEGLPHFYRSAPPIVLRDNWMYWGNTDAFEIRVYDIGSLAPRVTLPSRIIRYDRPNRPVDDQLRARYLKLLLGTARNHEDSTELVDEMTSRSSRSTLPAFQTLLIDASGNLWVEHTRLSRSPERMLDNNEAQTWTVFDSTGAMLGDVTTPAGLTIKQIGADWILGVWQDQDDVDHVRMYRITRSQ